MLVSSFLEYNTREGITRQLKITSQGAYALVLHFSYHDISSIERSENNTQDIESFTVGYNSSITISKKEILTFSNGYIFKVYLIDIEDYSKNRRVYLKCRLPNVSTNFIVPMFFIPEEENLVDKFLIGAFSGADLFYSVEVPIDHTMLVFRNSDFNNRYNYYELLEPKILSNVNYVSLVQLDEVHTGYIMSIPPIRYRDYKYVTSSKYSKLSPEYKAHLVDFYGLTDNSTMLKVLNKSNERKNELEEKLGLPQGTLNNVDLFERYNYKRELYKSDYQLKPDDKKVITL